MNREKHNGFALIVVIMTLSLMGVMLVVLGSASNSFLFEANAAYLDAADRSLSASGLAWAKYNVKNKNKIPEGRIPLDVNDMKLPHTTLSLDIAPGRDGKIEITTHTSAVRGKNRLRKDTVYLLPAP